MHPDPICCAFLCAICTFFLQKHRKKIGSTFKTLVSVPNKKLHAFWAHCKRPESMLNHIMSGRLEFIPRVGKNRLQSHGWVPCLFYVCRKLPKKGRPLCSLTFCCWVRCQGSSCVFTYISGEILNVQIEVTMNGLNAVFLSGIFFFAFQYSIEKLGAHDMHSRCRYESDRARR